MKKRFILIAIVASHVFFNASGQKFKQTDTARKQYTQFINIETNSGENIQAALDRITADSIFIVPLENDFVKVGRSRFKILKEEGESSLAVTEIKSYIINNDPYIVYPDCLEKRVREKKKQQFWKTTGRVGKVTGIAVLTVVGAGLAFYLSN